MCTYRTEILKVSASAKAREGWQPMTDATVYVDHPVHFPAGHALMIDFLNPDLGASARVGLEMNQTTARQLAHSILRALDETPPGILED